MKIRMMLVWFAKIPIVTILVEFTFMLRTAASSVVWIKWAGIVQL